MDFQKSNFEFTSEIRRKRNSFNIPISNLLQILSRSGFLTPAARGQKSMAGFLTPAARGQKNARRASKKCP